MSLSDEPAPKLGAADRAAVFEVLPTPYVVLTLDLVVVDMNEAYLAVTGRAREDLVGAHFLTAFPPPPDSLDADGRSELQVSLERVRDTGRPDTLPVQKYPIVGPDGVMTERHWLAVHVPVLDDDGAVRFIVQRTEDITEYSLGRGRAATGEAQVWRARAEAVEADLYVRARELADAVAAKDVAARRVASLTEATLALATAGSLAEVEQIVVGRALPVLGSDGGGIVSPNGAGGWRITVNESLGDNVRATYPDAPYDSMIPGCWAARTGERLLLPTRAAGLAFDAEVMTGIYAVARRSAWAFVPLLVGDRRLGSLAVSWVDEHELDADELDLLDGFASQCAQALLRIETESAQQQAALEVQQLAESLQQALLTPPPAPSDLHVVTRYRPAGHHAQIGGDWYDAFTQPDGATMLVIGDVVGHDSSAAAKMGQLRGVLRTLAYDADRREQPDTPATILARLDRVSRGLAVDTLATAVLARIEPPVSGQGRVMRWSNAGHPPPVLVRPDGTIDVLATDPELLLGFDPATARRDHVVELPDDATLVLYTDGLIERRTTTLDDSVDVLRDALADLAGCDPDELCDTLLARLAPEAGDDDIALVAVRVHGQGRRDVRLELPFDFSAPALARGAVLGQTTGLGPAARGSAELLVSELVTNAVRHGRPGVALGVSVSPDVVRVSVHDSGPKLPRLPAGRPDATSGSGRGLLIVDAIADAWGVEPDRAGSGKAVWFEVREDE